MTYQTGDEDGAPVILATVGDLATTLGVPASLVSMWTQRRVVNTLGHRFPAPVAQLRAGNGTKADHYDRDDVVLWACYYVADKGRGRRKLTPADATAIREAYAAGGWSHRSLAKKYGVTHRVIGRILTAGREAS